VQRKRSPYLNLAQAAHQLGLSRARLIGLIHAQRLRAKLSCGHWWIERESLDALLARSSDRSEDRPATAAPAVVACDRRLLATILRLATTGIPFHVVIDVAAVELGDSSAGVRERWDALKGALERCGAL
jgi:hypothetical protein